MHHTKSHSLFVQTHITHHKQDNQSSPDSNFLGLVYSEGEPSADRAAFCSVSSWALGRVVEVWRTGQAYQHFIKLTKGRVIVYAYISNLAKP